MLDSEVVVETGIGKFAQDTSVRRIDDTTWEGDFSGDWNVGQVPNGGYALAMGAKPLAEILPHRDPMTVTAYYVARTEPGPVRCEVEVLRVGKGTSTGMVRMIQNGETKIQIIGTYTDFDKISGENFSNINIPDMPAFEACVDTPVRDFNQLRKQLIQRVTPRNARALEGESDPSATWMGWTDFADGSEIDLFALLMFADSTPPPVFAVHGPKGWVPTLDLSVQIHRRPEPGPLRFMFTSPVMTQGTVDEDGWIWDSGDNLVALVRQTAKFRAKN
ncbi:MAG: thioesterase family protein [Porticoccaceae bacterium]